MRWAIDTRKMAGALALAGGVLVLGTALAQALRPETAPLPEAPPEVLPAVDLAEQGTHPVPAASPSPATSSISDEIVREAANQAPFDPERRPPTQRYRLPGERQQVVEEEPRFEMPPVPPLRVLGTIAGPGGGIAVLQEAGEPPRVVSVGQTIGEYLLVADDRGVSTGGSAEGGRDREPPGMGSRADARGRQYGGGCGIRGQIREKQPKRNKFAGEAAAARIPGAHLAGKTREWFSGTD